MDDSHACRVEWVCVGRGAWGSACERKWVCACPQSETDMGCEAQMEQEMCTGREGQYGKLWRVN
jgi:hypothetical protein